MNGGGDDRIRIEPSAAQGGAPAGRRQSRWLEAAHTHAEVELRLSIDEARRRRVDEIALRRIWSRVASFPDLHGTNAALPVRRVRWPWLIGAGVLGAAAASLIAPWVRDAGKLAGGELAMPAVASSRVEANAAPGAAAASAVKASPETTGESVATGTDVAGASHPTEPSSSGVRAARGTSAVARRVETGSGQTMRLALRGGAEARLAARSTVLLGDSGAPTVESGDVWFRVRSQSNDPNERMSVSVGVYRVTVAGARFRVRALPTGVSVGVESGTVEIRNRTNNQRVARLRAGETWSTELERATTASSAIGASAGTAAGAAAATGAGEKSRATVAPSPRAVAAPPATEAAWGTTAVPAPRELTPSVASAPVRAPASSSVDAAEPKLDTSDPQRLAAAYRSMAQRSGPGAENAAYELGRVLRDRLHKPREAITAWRDYREQHPRGLLRVEADVSIIETLLAVGDRSEALRESREFIRRQPQSERRPEIARVVGDLERERGDCAAAAAAYDIAVADGSRPAAESAAFHRGVCLLGQDRGRAEAALRQYLKWYPQGRYRTEAQRLLSPAGEEHANASVR